MQVFNYAICVIWGVCKKNSRINFKIRLFLDTNFIQITR